MPSKNANSSTSSSFSSHLSSLISSASTAPKTSTSNISTISGRIRPKKDSIFSTHNRGALKRAHADISTSSPAFEQKHSTSGEALDDGEWRRRKRRMEEKARLYAQMKRGDVEDADEKHMVDFDRKWAEREEQGRKPDSDTSSHDNSSDDDGDHGAKEIVEYIDEFGRTRQGTRAEAEREEMRKKRGVDYELDRDTARPAAPSNIIRGDTVQVNAFNPDETIAEQMARIAAKRDKEETPPPETYYDARKEMRKRGQGFFQFSTDNEERKQQMENLEREREDTEKKRRERDERKEARKKEIEERRRVIGEKRGKRQAAAFLDELGAELDTGKDPNDGKTKAENETK
ncbi:MAG: hypothetical protein M1820_003146 [Bogoriella megaspora]|nr:MAG: hypothetical protein M1820_003146 [Bogoriella megaspora]